MTSSATTSDEWFDHFIDRLENDSRRVRTAISELYRPLPPTVLRERVFEAETARLLGELHDQRERDALVPS